MIVVFRGFPGSLADKKYTCNAGAAAPAAKSLQSCPTLCDPMDGSPPGSPVPGILQARTLEWVATSFSINAGDSSSIPRSGWSPGERIGYSLQYSWASLVVQMVKNLPEVQETWVHSLSWEDPLEGSMATQSSIPSGESPWTEELDRLQSMGLERVEHDRVTKHSSAQ